MISFSIGELVGQRVVVYLSTNVLVHGILREFKRMLGYVVLDNELGRHFIRSDHVVSIRAVLED